ncbi:MAG: DUF6624 domain-containing protein [Algoriphagus aquaeductus]|uniref:DUF6624 domain-containing protein n=1 Tax=Algoriphagus aquaeductus TaxID=475299 RepID=UPI003919B05A
MNVIINKLLGFKWIVFLFFFLTSCDNEAQEYVTKLDNYPPKKVEVSEEKYRKATYILEQTFNTIKKDSFQIKYADHLNLAHAYALLLEPKELIFSELNLAQEKDLESTAAVFVLAVRSPEHFRLTQSEYDSLSKRFHMIHDQSKNRKELFDIKEYVSKGNYDKELVETIASIEERDQKHWAEDSNMELQNKSDEENFTLIDSLYEKYESYIGKTLVGDKYNHVMWLIIQHSDLNRQEKYLPIILQAVRNDELEETPLKMLIDRIQTKKCGYQIFGSQLNVPLASDEIIKEIKNNFNIE